MGKWATYRRRGSTPDRTLCTPPPAPGDWSASKEPEDGDWTLYGAQTEPPPDDSDARRYRWRVIGQDWNLSTTYDVEGTEAVLVNHGPDVNYEVQMRWEHLAHPSHPGLWSSSHFAPPI